MSKNFLKLSEVFQVYKSAKIGIYQYIDGRLLNNMNIKDKFVIVRSINIKNCDEKSCLYVDNSANLKYVKIDNILSYGEYWQFLDKGMSAHIKCKCDIEIVKDDLIYKLIS